MNHLPLMSVHQSPRILPQRLHIRLPRIALAVLTVLMACELGACGASPPKPVLPDGSHRVPVNHVTPAPPVSPAPPALSAPSAQPTQPAPASSTPGAAS